MSDMTWATVDSVPARVAAPGFRVRTLWTAENGAKAQFVEIDPGATYGSVETHLPGPEEVFVVSGVFNDGERDYPAGTFIHAPTGSQHLPQSATGCTLFLFYPLG